MSALTDQKAIEAGHTNPAVEVDIEANGDVLRQGETEVKPPRNDDNTECLMTISEDDLFEDLPFSDHEPICTKGPFVRLGNLFSRWLELQDKLSRCRKSNKSLEKKIIHGIFAFLYNVFFFYAVYNFVQYHSGELDWCNGLGLLIILTVVVYGGLFYRHVVRRGFHYLKFTTFGRKCCRIIFDPLSKLYSSFMSTRWSSAILYLLVMTIFIVFLVIDTADDRRRLMSAFGTVILVVLCAIFSTHPSRIRWRHVFWGLGLQYIFGLIILRWDVGQQNFCLSRR